MHFLFRGNIKQRDQLFDMIRSEQAMTETAVKRDSHANAIKTCVPVEADAIVLSGVSITADRGVDLIQQYCAKLPYEKY